MLLFFLVIVITDSLQIRRVIDCSLIWPTEVVNYVKSAVCYLFMKRMQKLRHQW